MKFAALFYLLIISSCGQKGDGSNNRMTPLLPAPVIIKESTETDLPDTESVLLEMLNEKGIRIEPDSYLPDEPAVIICFNTQFLNSEKIEDLHNYRETISDETIETRIERTKLLKLVGSAIESLQSADPDDYKCPKIFLAISK